jgi:multiple sugar transport system permease protein
MQRPNLDSVAATSSSRGRWDAPQTAATDVDKAASPPAVALVRAGRSAAGPPRTSRPARGRGRRAWAIRRQLTPYVFLSPFLALFVLFLFVPLLYALKLSLYADRLIGGEVFVGLDNFRRAVHDPALWSGIRRMALFGAIQIPVMLGLALVLALVLDAGTVRLRRLFRLGFFLPYAVPSVVAALMWGYLYGGTFGPFAQLADYLGVTAPGFLTPRWMLASIANIVTWEYVGYNMIILYAALQAVPRELYEAAAMDGASGRQIARHVKVPLIAPALVLTTVFSIIGTLQLFNEPQIMTSVAPEVIGSSYTPNLYAYSLAFRNQQFNYSAAISFVLGAVVFAGSYLFMWLVSRRSREAGPLPRRRPS